MDGASISALAAGISSAVSTTRALLSMKVDGEVKAAISELQFSLITTQSAALESLAERDEMRRRIDSLEQEIQRKAVWDEVRSRFVDYETNLALAYRSDDERHPGLYCPKCFENEKISRMQEVRSNRRGHSGNCLQCGTQLQFSPGAPINYVG